MGLSPGLIRLMAEVTRRYQQGDTKDALEKIRNLGEQAVERVIQDWEAIAPALEKLEWIDQFLVDTIDYKDKELDRGALHFAHEKMKEAIEALEGINSSGFWGTNDIADLNQASTFLEERTDAMYRELYNSPK